MQPADGGRTGPEPIPACDDAGMTGPSIGSRVATHRRRRGLSQVALAGLVGRSESWLSQVERGARTVDSLSVLRELARVLRVDLDDLAGPPLPKPPVVTDIATDRLAAAETALFGRTCNDRLPAGQSHIAELHTAYQQAEYAVVIDALPILIEGLDPTGHRLCWRPDTPSSPRRSRSSDPSKPRPSRPTAHGQPPNAAKTAATSARPCAR